MVAASAGLLLAWAAGACLGPLLASIAMEMFGSSALFLYLAATRCDHGRLSPATA